MSYQLLIGLNVRDNRKLLDFQASIESLLVNYDGERCYDFNAPDSLLSSRHNAINYAFTLSFSSKEKAEAFVAGPKYRQLRGRHLLKTFGAEQVVFGFQN